MQPVLQPKVSIVIPVYNVEKYLTECLVSVVSQTLREIEVICVNDGSTDGSGEILAHFASTDSRVKVFTQENGGAAKARNLGLSKASGEFVLFFDADDYLATQNALENLLNICLKTDVQIAVCRAFDKENGELKENNHTVNLALLQNATKICLDNKNIFLFKNGSHQKDVFDIFEGFVWEKLFRLEFVKKLNLTFQDLKNSNDTFFSLFALANALRVVVVDERLVVHVVTNGSVSNSRESAPFECVKAYKKLKDEFEKVGKFALVERSYFNYMSKFFLWHLKSLKTKEAKEALRLNLRAFFDEVGFLQKSEFFTKKRHFTRLKRAVFGGFFQNIFKFKKA